MVQVATVSSKQEKVHLHKALLDFHGEALLLMHWSILAYTGLVKIMKKYHKHTGCLLRAPAAQHLLAQPFCSTEVRSLAAC
jgi:SPX domain protein involved in polyphosphate accumulation